ncbi:MAG: polysaccharide ABC transporter ATP-binding protein [Chitinophagaceae bacterium]
MKPIIEVNNLSKRFIIAHESKERYTALRDVVVQKAKKIFSFPTAIKPATKVTKEEFWALKDVSFDVQQGDRIGIIGRNGAGKSTLLKILSRITEPTVGEIKIRGRVASLLEVGTGFHPELTGRENIFLNGAILGMSRAEIKAKFDEIVDFAEVEKFLDTPVKRYSSGMYVRLAFAVAAHLEPEVLIVDEVLAVGDAQFQKKCLGKMEDVSKNEGRTVLFVSHQINVINQLCNYGVLLKNGKLIDCNFISAVVNQYLTSNIESNTRTKNFEVSALTVKNQNDETYFCFNDSIFISFNLKNVSQKAITDLSFRFKISGESCSSIATFDTWKGYQTHMMEAYESISIEFLTEKLNLSTGQYYLSIWAHSYNLDIWDCIVDNFKISFINHGLFKTSDDTLSLKIMNYSFFIK